MLGPVRDQGNRSTCLAFAATAAHEQARPEDAPLGEELLYWACKQIDDDGLPGTYPESAALALSDPGQSDAALWPYDATRVESAADYAPPAAALAPDAARTAKLQRVPATLGVLGDLITAGHAVVLGLELWPAFYAAGAGDLDPPTSADLLGDGHAVALVGIDSDVLTLRNSWGKSWGDAGHGRLPAAALPVVSRGAWVLHV